MDPVQRPFSTMLANDPLEVVVAPIAPFWIPTLNLLLGEEVRKRTKKDRKRNPNAIEVAAQNVFDRPNGAFTGELSAEQLMDIGLRWTLVGHSERRVVLSEDDSVGAPFGSRKLLCKTRCREKLILRRQRSKWLI